MIKMRIKDFSIKEVYQLVEKFAEPSFRAGQLLDWIYKKKVSDFDEMTNLPREFRLKLKEKMKLDTLEPVESFTSDKDGTIKLLCKLEDTHIIEVVVMKHEYGNTVCISSQVGCSVGCTFCASARGGFVRNLSSGEMLDQVIKSENYLLPSEKIKNIVVMGMGEPLYNYTNLLKFLIMANDSRGLGISFRNMTVSTVGIVPRILELAGENLPLTLAISLHAPDNETRSKLVPINEKYPIEEILTACEKYIDLVGRRITFEYILIDGVNDSREKAIELSHLIKGLLSHVNLIPINPIKGVSYRATSLESMRKFYNVLEHNNIPVSVRSERGSDIEGACGQLRRRYVNAYK